VSNLVLVAEFLVDILVHEGSLPDTVKEELIDGLRVGITVPAVAENDNLEKNLLTRCHFGRFLSQPVSSQGFERREQ
jgi:hypothetical protein